MNNKELKNYPYQYCWNSNKEKNQIINKKYNLLVRRVIIMHTGGKSEKEQMIKR